jgi:hypothetical protein
MSAECKHLARSCVWPFKCAFSELNDQSGKKNSVSC